AGLTRDELVAVLHAENVLARRYFFPGCHGMEPYRSLAPNAHYVLENTTRLARRVLVLPTGMAMSKKGIAKICRILRTALSNPAAVKSSLSGKSNDTEHELKCAATLGR